MSKTEIQINYQNNYKFFLMSIMKKKNIFKFKKHSWIFILSEYSSRQSKFVWHTEIKICWDLTVPGTCSMCKERINSSSQLSAPL